MRDSPVVRRPARSCRKTGGTDRPRGVVLTAAVVVLVAATGPLAAQGSTLLPHSEPWEHGRSG